MKISPLFYAALCGAILVSSFSTSTAFAQEKLDKKQMVSMLAEIDERQRNVGDYKALVFIDQKRKGKEDLAYKAVVYRRDQENKQVILFLQPKSEAGKGYLRLNKNLFLFDPSVGKWERRTERESIGGTGSRRRDFDASSFAKNYEPEYIKLAKLGKRQAHQMTLTAKKGKDVAYPKLSVWIDTKTRNILKVQEYAASGRLMRTSYYPKWHKVFSPSKKKDVYYPKRILIFDEIEKGNKTNIVMNKINLTKLQANIFTKAWVESKSN